MQSKDGLRSVAAGVFFGATTLGGMLTVSADQGDPPQAGALSPKVACIAADTDGQRLRLEGEFRKARDRLKDCANPSCPQIVRDDCAERIAEVDKHVAYVTFAATNGDGRTLRAVDVFVDDDLVTRVLDARPLVVDPGEHTFRFSTLGRVVAEVTLTLKESSRTSHAVVLRTKVETKEGAAAGLSTSETWTLEGSPKLNARDAGAAAPKTAAPGRAVPAATTPSATFIDLDTGNGRIEAAALGVGALGIGLGVTFGLLTLSSWHSAQHDCQEPCPAGPQADSAQREASDAKVDGNISTLAFVGGAAAIVGGGLLWWTDRSVADSSQSLHVVPNVGPGGAQLTLRSRF
jgi:hypothetical protein